MQRLLDVTDQPSSSRALKEARGLALRLSTSEAAACCCGRLVNDLGAAHDTSTCGR